MSVVYRLRLFGRLVGELEIESDDVTIHVDPSEYFQVEDGPPEPLQWVTPEIEDPEGHLVWGDHADDTA